MSEDIFAQLWPELQMLLRFQTIDFRDRQDLHSPIERIFAASLVLRGRIQGAQIATSRERAAGLPLAYFLEPQVSIGAYRVDFLLGVGRFHDDMSKAIVVECDGHQWHERSKEKAAADKARDRYLSTQVARVLRFTGSEIWVEPSRCSDEAMRVLNVVLEGQWP